jgi:large subunit ribosomal protein L29
MPGAMKAAKLRELSEDELRQRGQELTQELFNLRVQLSMGVAKNPSRVGQARRELARVYTVLNERGAAAAPAPAAPAAAPAPAPGAAPAAPAPSARAPRRRVATGAKPVPKAKAKAKAKTKAKTSRKG